MALLQRFRQYLHQRGISISNYYQRKRSRRSAIATVAEGQPSIPEGQPLTPEGQPSTPKVQPSTPEGQPLTLREQPTTPIQRESISNLLALRAEIRNMIYAHALIEDDEILIDPALRQPGLLQACRQLRQETMTIWYDANEFFLPIRRCEGTMAVKWDLHCRTLLLAGHGVGMRGQRTKEPVHTTYEFTDSSNWKNLKAWLLARWQNGIPTGGQFVCGDDSGALRFMTAAHKLVNLFLKRPWKEFEEAVESLRAAVGAYVFIWNDRDDVRDPSMSEESFTEGGLLGIIVRDPSMSEESFTEEMPSGIIVA